MAKRIVKQFKIMAPRAGPIGGHLEVEAADHWVYKINYASPDGVAVLEVFLHADGILRLKNPNEVVWTRK